MKKLLLIIIIITICDVTFATELTMKLTDKSTNMSGGFSSTIIQTMVVMAILSVAPSIVIMFSSFIKISVVLSILRSGLGLQQTPSNAILASLALFLTFFVMQDTIQEIYEDAIEPLVHEKITNEMAWENLQKPLINFMLNHTSEKELNLFLNMNHTQVEKNNVPIHVLTPAFMICELRKAFEIGFLIFLPFLIIDLVVSSILMAMGMMMLPPATVALPFKLIFFVLVDGWYMICGSLVKSYGL